MLAVIPQQSSACHSTCIGAHHSVLRAAAIRPASCRLKTRRASHKLSWADRRPAVLAAATLSDDAASAAELYARDQLLEQLLQATSREQLGQLVADNVLSLDKQFFLRLALKHDEAASPEDKARLQSMASTIANLMEGIVQASQMQTDESAQTLQQILAAAADERGEWRLPLSEQKDALFQQAVRDHFDQLDEALLSNAYAWMRKCKADGLTDVYVLIQRVVQIYAALALVRRDSNSSNKAEACLDAVISAKPTAWADTLWRHVTLEQISQSAFSQALQRRMESVVLTLQSGSHSQRVQAEFLKEVELTSADVFKNNKKV